jgi:hypothetical protein
MAEQHTKQKNLDRAIECLLIGPNLLVNVRIDPDRLLILRVDFGAYTTHGVGVQQERCSEPNVSQ